MVSLRRLAYALPHSLQWKQMTDKLLGTWPKINDPRDAVHVAIIPALCATDFKVGDQVLIKNTEEGIVAEYCAHNNYDAVIDPYLMVDPLKGQVVWVLMRPGSILSIRHEWYHPKVQHPDKVVAANMRLEAFAKGIGSDVDQLLSKARSYVDYGYHWSEGGRFEGQGLYESFWEDYQTVTGEIVAEEYQDHFFSCSC